MEEIKPVVTLSMILNNKKRLVIIKHFNSWDYRGFLRGEKTA